MEEQKAVNNKDTEKTEKPRELKFKLGNAKGFDEAVKRLKLNDKDSSH